MRNIVVAIGSGTEDGNTARLADAFINGARDAGHQVERVFLGNDMHGCRGCGACQITGKCAINDTMTAAYPFIDKCDTIVMASPLYFWTFSAQIKMFMDRLYAISKEDIYPKKDVMLLMTSGDDSTNTFDIPLAYHQFITAALGWKDIGSYLAGGCSGQPGGHAIKDEHLKNAYNIGRMLV